jgi:tetratricopeptide (TPR) repeat protein
MDTTRRTNCCKLTDVPKLIRKRAPRAARSLALVACMLSSYARLPSARAEAPSAEAAAEARRSEAKARFQEGVTAFGQRRYEDAVHAFQKADAIQPSSALSFNIARAFERLADTPAALRWYRDYLRRAPQATNSAEVQARVSELAATLALRGVQQLSVLSTPEGATVLIDRQPAGVTPLTTELPPGVHQVRLRAAGYRDFEGEVTLDARTPRDLNVSLTQPGTPGVTGAPSPRGAPGAANTPSGGTATAADQPTRPFGVLPWVVLGAGGASMLGALGFELGRRGAESAAKEAPQRTYQEHFDAMQSRQTTARVLFGVGGALLIGGGTLLLLNAPKAPAAQVALGCVGGGCGLLAEGSF